MGGVLDAFHDAGEELAALADTGLGEAEEFGIDDVLLLGAHLGDGEGDGVWALDEEVVPDQAFEVGAEAGVTELLGAEGAGFG